MIISVIKRFPFFRRYSTKSHSKWWANRNIDWKKDYLATWKHPHRYMITAVLKTLPWYSLIEIGCGPGPNLVNIIKGLPKRQLGGIDVNPDAIKLATEVMQGGVFKVNSADDIMMSDKSTDVILSDRTLAYVGPLEIDRYIAESRRLARKYLVLCEFHHESFWARLKLRLFSGLHAYDYRKLLAKHDFYDVQIYKVPPEGWPDNDYAEFSYIIIAKAPSR